MATVNVSNDTDFAFQVPTCGMTLEQFVEWSKSDKYPKRGKVLFDRGELVFDMSPERIDFHGSLKEAVNYTIQSLVRGSKLGRFYVDGATVRHKEARVSNEPDAMFVRWDTFKTGKVWFVASDPAALYGSPDWVCEIVSDSSIKKDTQVLRARYHAAGIAEYWLLDARGDQIDFELLIWTPEGYVESPSVEGWRFSPVFDREFEVSRERDEVGQWLYDLNCR